MQHLIVAQTIDHSRMWKRLHFRRAPYDHTPRTGPHPSQRPRRQEREWLVLAVGPPLKNPLSSSEARPTSDAVGTTGRAGPPFSSPHNPHVKLDLHGPPCLVLRGSAVSDRVRCGGVPRRARSRRRRASPSPILALDWSIHPEKTSTGSLKQLMQGARRGGRRGIRVPVSLS